MIIKDNNKTFEFTPVSYEFPGLTKDHKKYDEWDSNWLTLRFSYSDGQGLSGSENDSCLLTYEMTDFIKDLKRLAGGQEDSAELDTMEPYFKIRAAKNQNGYRIDFLFYYFIEERKDIEPFEVTAFYGCEELKRFIEELEAEFKPFPKR